MVLWIRVALRIRYEVDILIIGDSSGASTFEKRLAVSRYPVVSENSIPLKLQASADHPWHCDNGRATRSAGNVTSCYVPVKPTFQKGRSSRIGHCTCIQSHRIFWTTTRGSHGGGTAVWQAETHLSLPRHPRERTRSESSGRSRYATARVIAKNGARRRFETPRSFRLSVQLSWQNRNTCPRFDQVMSWSQQRQSCM